MIHLSRCLILSLIILPVSYQLCFAEDWTRFRGDAGTGVSALQGVPTQWSQEDYEWVIDLPGKGHSSPTIWGNQLFITTGTDQGERTILCLNATTGETLWKDSIKLEANHLHQKNSYASGTPATDGQRVYVVFADEQHYTLLTYDMLGTRLWSQDLGTFSSQHGQGVSPIVYKGKVIVPDDQKGPSKIVAYNAENGETVWVSERQFITTSYSTPMILEVAGRDQLICLSGALGLSAIDPETGKALWQSGELPQRTVASPIYGEGLLFATCGSGGRGKLMIAVDPTSNGQVAAQRVQNLPYVPTPVIHEGHLYLWNDDGIVCCVDLSGDLSNNVWRERVGGAFSGSPVLIDGKLYCISEEGEVVVIDANPVFKLHGRSPLGDQSYSTPAVANGRVYFRGFHSLASLKAKTPATVGQR